MSRVMRRGVVRGECVTVGLDERGRDQKGMQWLNGWTLPSPAGSSCDCIANPSGCGHTRSCVCAADRLRKNSIPKAGAVRRLLPVWLCAFHWLWPDHHAPARKRVSTSGEGCRCGLVCGVVFGDSGPVVDETEAGDCYGQWELGFGRRPVQDSDPHLC